MIVQLQDDGADTVQKETVMSHHQQGLVTSSQITLQPFYHLQVEVVGRLVEYQQIGFHQQHVGKCDPFLLTTTQLSHRLVKVAYLQLCQHLFCLQHLLLFSMMIKAGIKDTLLWIKPGGLFQKADSQVTTEDDIARIVSFLTSKD